MFCGGSSSFCVRRRVELAREHHAVVHDRRHAVEHLAAGGELAGLGEA
jgi:hypothetical protein